MAIEYKTLVSNDDPKGRTEMAQNIDRFSRDGWAIKSREVTPQNYSFGKTCCLGCIFLPLALLGKKKGIITVIMERKASSSNVAQNIPQQMTGAAPSNLMIDTTDIPWYKTWWGILLIIGGSFFAFIIMLGIILAAAVSTSETIDDGSGNNTESAINQKEGAAKPDYEIKVVGNTYADTTRRRLTFTVTNTGSVDANPACNIHIQSPDGQYQGIDYVTWDTPLKPGEVKYFEDLITITNNGAVYATKSDVSCLER